MVKVFLSTPCYGGLCLDKYMISVIKLQLLLINKGVQLMIDIWLEILQHEAYFRCLSIS